MAELHSYSEESERMARELFLAVEKEQGLAYISDAIGVLSPDEIVDLARRCREHHKSCMRILSTWIGVYERKGL